jgi:hypothetical protein
MSHKEDGDPAAAEMARKRWKIAGPAAASEHARKMLEARWGKKKTKTAKGKKAGK